MRDEKRIDPIIHNIQDFWHAHPDLRFWQVISIIFEHTPKELIGDDNMADPFYWEDDIWKRMTDELKKR